ncbi:MAG: alpha/beta hydrolase [Lachnospiraceae bacterium]|nr:alpha/beta hydrolase [Lachnospiraceae bacterium]
MGYKINEVPERITKMRAAWAASDARRDAGLTEPESLEKFRDISYGPYDKWNLLDVYIPKDINSNAKLQKENNESGCKGGSNQDSTAQGLSFPVIVNIHGGGYFYGDKELYRFYAMHIAEAGFAVVNFNYRLAPEFRFPAPLEDAMAVMHWIRENADKYGLDEKNIFIVGDSAGAQITSQFACIFTNPDYAELFGLKAPEGTVLRAISLACGMYRMPERAHSERDDQIMKDYLGTMELLDDPRVELHSNITDGYPPAYIFSAYNDFLLTECKPMADFLSGKGIETKMKIYGSREEKDVAHVFHCNMRLAEGEKANKDQLDFFKEHIV